jgi:hypothetical protein
MQNPSPVEVVPGSVSGVQAAPVERPAQTRRLTGGKLLALSLGMFALTLGVQSLLMVGVRALVGDGPAFWGFATSIVGGVGYGSTVVLALLGAARSIAELARAPVWRAGPYSVLTSVAIAVSSLVMVGLGILAALLSTFGFSRGRQLRRRGRVLLPPVQAGAAWVGSGFVPGSPQLAPPGLAQQWRENGRTEHASVASFARLTLDLMALGAPPALVASANHDALDEIRHTEACFGLAHWFDGEPASPGAFP